MNKVYKVIYSKARQCYVVVSELAKNHHKSVSNGGAVVGSAKLSRLLVAAFAAGVLTWGGLSNITFAAESDVETIPENNTVTSTDKNKTTAKDLNANIKGKDNNVTNSKDTEIVGDSNTVTDVYYNDDGKTINGTVPSNNVRVVGSNNSISGSRNQHVIGDNNTIIGRDDGTVTDYQHPDGRESYVSDLTIGRDNFIRGDNTYRNEWDSLTVIGNHNRADYSTESAGGPAAGIVIGDNQNIDDIEDSIVIGSLSPSEQQKKTDDNDDLYSVGSNNIIIGYHTKTARYGGGVVVGNRSQGSGIYETIMGPRSIIGNNTSDSYQGSGVMASIYGAFNKIEDAAGGSVESASDVDGVGNSINGSLNITSSARGTMIMGVGNTVTHAKGPDILGKDEDTPGATGYWANSGLFGADYYAQGADTEAEGNTLNISYDEMRNAWQKYMETSGGAVSVLGNSNNADYAIRSQILGTSNTITGSETDMSAYNTVSGFANTGTNIKRSAIVGTGNTLKNGEDNVVIGDYHNLENGKHNVILGSMDYTEKQVKKQSKSTFAMTDEHPDGTFEYTVTEQVPVKEHKNDIENAVMVGYNTDVTQNGGVALGSDSVASTKAGAPGYDALGKKHNNSDKDYSAWVSTDAAVSVGRVEKKDTEGKVTAPAITRQITNLAAGFNDTDAVNVAQLKAVMNLPVHIYNGGKVASSVYTGGTQIAKDMTISNLQFDFGDGLLAQEVGSEGDKRVLVTLDKDALKDDPDFKGPKGDTGAKGPKGDTGAPGKDGKDGKDGGVGTVVGDANITVTNDETDSTKPARYKVSLNKQITVDKVATGNTTISKDGLSIAGGPSITKSGIDAGGRKITKVAAGTETTDAVNYGQLKDVESKVDNNAQNITNINGRVNNLDSKINKVGAGAAALAALHPLDFDPDDKWDFAVGYGNYRDANSVAVGAFYRPDEDTMFSLGTNFGNGENMINAGVSFKFGQKGKTSSNRLVINKEVTELRATVSRQDEQLKKQDDQLKKQDNEIKELKDMVSKLLAAQNNKAEAAK